MSTITVWYRANHPVESADTVEVTRQEPKDDTGWTAIQIPHSGDADDDGGIDLAAWNAVWDDYTEAYLIGHAIYCYIAIMRHFGLNPIGDFDTDLWFEPDALDPTGEDGPDSDSLEYLRAAVDALEHATEAA